MVAPKEGLVRSSGAAEVAQCFEVWVCFEGEEYLGLRGRKLWKKERSIEGDDGTDGAGIRLCEKKDVFNDSE